MKPVADAIKDDRHYTYADYQSWPDEERWELIGGVAWNMSAAPATIHQRISWELVGQIRTALEGSDCSGFAAPLDVFPLATISDNSLGRVEDIDTVVQPDIVVVCDQTKIVERGCMGPPDLVMEIISPSTLSKDLSVKRDLYQRAGVREYWIVDPGFLTVLVFTIKDDGSYPVDARVYEAAGTVRSTAVPAVEIDVATLFRKI